MVQFILRHLTGRELKYQKKQLDL